MRRLPCACGNVALACCARRPSAAKGQRGPITAVNLCLSERGTKTRLLSKGGRARGKPDLSETKIAFTLQQTLSNIGHVGKQGPAFALSFRLLPLFAFPASAEVHNWPLQPLDVTS